MMLNYLSIITFILQNLSPIFLFFVFVFSFVVETGLHTTLTIINMTPHLHADPPSHKHRYLTHIYKPTHILTDKLQNLHMSLFFKYFTFFCSLPFLLNYSYKELLSLPSHCTALLFSLVSGLQVRCIVAYVI